MFFINLFFFIYVFLMVLLTLFLLNLYNFNFFIKLTTNLRFGNIFILLISIIFIISLNLIYFNFNTSYSYNYFLILNVYYFPFIFIFLFITFLSILFCLMYNINETTLFSFYAMLMLFIGINLFFSDFIIFFFFFYEMLLVPSFFILYKFAKTRRAVEAAYLMFFWTQFGALFLIFSLLYLFFITNSSNFTSIELSSLTQFDINFLTFFFIIGFGVKFPIWPFYGWLPKAHVEASTNFSIFLSGVLVKFAFFGFLKLIFLLKFETTLICIIPILIIGILDSSFKLFYQIDLKKIVAYSTVIEMHWLTLSIMTGYSWIFLAGFCMLVSHAFLSTNFFFLVDSINRRYKSRLITEIYGISLVNTKLFLIVLLNLLIFLGFPGTLFFVAEVLFFSFMIDFFPTLSILFLIMLYLIVPTIFFKSWWSAMCGESIIFKKNIILDLDSIELLILSSSTTILFWLGMSWQLFLI